VSLDGNESRVARGMGTSTGLSASGRVGRASALAVAGTLLASSLAPTWGAEAIPGPTAIDTDQMEAIVADIERAAALAATELEGFSSDRLQRELVLEQTGSDPMAIRDWVSQHTTWVPYEGVLRGADGVLMDRTGNSLDRALLLAALLDDAGHATRLTHASLSPDAAASVVASSGAAVDGDAATPPLEAVPELAGYLEAIERNSEAVLGLVDSSVDSAAELDAADAAAADHWWVQAEVDGTWQDLDPAGLIVEGVPEVVEASDETDALADLRHSVTIRLVAERTEPDEVTTFVPLEYTHALGTGDPLPTFELEFTPAITASSR
jgi:transglutaminase-like putative cysteine protease